jgi:HSP20 family molecular chaperone IbpA
MKCGKCGSGVDSAWQFCPSCGSPLRRTDDFSDVFERMEQEMKGMSKAFERNFEVIDLSPMFPKNMKPMRGSGFSIKITQGGGGKPKFDIQTFGDVNRKEVESEASKLGFRDRLSRAFKADGQEPQPAKRVCFEKAKTTAEPETCVRNVDGKIVAEVKLPGVKRAEDIELRLLESSVEIKALAGDKAYFKILTKPPQAKVARREFRKGLLVIELA